MKVYSGSDIGLKRDSNQDYCKTGELSDGVVWAVVCDGMGGANGGCTASSVAAETIADFFTEYYDPEMTSGSIRDLMEDAISEANEEVYRMSIEDSSLYGMGTTVVFAVAKNGKIHIVHAGDSRAYLYRRGILSRVTKDHSIVQELVSAGRITDEEARNHPSRNIITRALGVEPELFTDYNSEEFGDGSVLMICTDGLSGYFGDSELCRFMEENSGDELIAKLISAAKDKGGSDNITVAVIAEQ